ncbi:NAD kinase [Nesterenkonia sp. LB17]|uniref:NAD kinase n=1 Tax=unclassified Nesterenkonia TaxID=2629769 RepID=UPI001F4D0CD7|nr:MULTISPECIES: NAD kinase [unclassified Nesterenkonia]MCH8561079.1 NAD kinase [Nesterenkonia sp. DZ6]MCH8562619.1 NAD kinase [Nesterenkonia sp. YGD6]MCH8565541.1 NAD kinase [Nesterenkonia sp. LB17]
MTREILLLAHTGRRDAVEAAVTVAERLHSAGLRPVMMERDIASLNHVIGDRLRGLPLAVAEREVPLTDCEVGMVLGGDGSILRAADLVRGAGLPLMGVNLGHVGFLAESERTELDASVQWVVDQNYTVERRMALDVQVWHAGRHVGSSWALNEASIEKQSRERMIDLIIEIDGRPVSAFGCDGVVMATPTGSTAYAFSAGGPVVWPEVQALVMVPISAHALFSRPLVADPDSIMAVEVLQREDEQGVLWCDGRRFMELPPGSRVEVTRSAEPVLLARVHQTPFSERLVDKFNLPTTGWRGPVDPANQVETPDAFHRGEATQR